MSEQYVTPAKPVTDRMRLGLRILLLLTALMVVGVLVWQGITSHGAPDPTAPSTSRMVALLDIAVLVFREGLECVLVLTAITASMTGEKQSHRRPVMAGAGIAFIATLITWFIAVGIVTDLGQNVSALNLQAATGLLAVVVPVLYLIHTGGEAGGNHFGYAMAHLGAHYVGVAALGLLAAALWRSLPRR